MRRKCGIQICPKKVLEAHAVYDALRVMHGLVVTVHHPCGQNGTPSARLSTGTFFFVRALWTDKL